MGYYFDNTLSMDEGNGSDLKNTIRTIAAQYVGNNPENMYTFRPYSAKGISRDREYRYKADFNRFFPDAEDEQYVYAWGTYFASSDIVFKFDITPYGPMAVFINGKPLYQTDIFSERYTDSRISIDLPLQTGWNNLIIRFKKTKAGFGGIFGTWLGKLCYFFLMPGKYSDQEGFIFSCPVNTPLSILEDCNPGSESSVFEQLTDLRWYPEMNWDRETNNKYNMQRIFGVKPGRTGIGKSKIRFPNRGTEGYRITGYYSGSTSVYIAGEEVLSLEGSGSVDEEIAAPFGNQDILVYCMCDQDDWGFDFSIYDGNNKLGWYNPLLKGKNNYPWLYLGVFPGKDAPLPEQLNNGSSVFMAETGLTYWRLDGPGLWLRQYNENPLFGHWNYPIGVTLYGLLHSAIHLDSVDLGRYVEHHVQQSVDTFDYAFWDKEQFGGATGVHHLLTSIDSLDDCGSFAATLLEVAAHRDIRDFRKIADFVAEYITKKQIRLEDGTFFRKNLMHHFHEDTLWADDLYMSIPFLCRYAALSGDSSYLDDAASQFIGFKKLLYIAEDKIMSHVYDFKRNMATGVPWGRGNGWVLFSLAELLTVLPKQHSLYDELTGFFTALSEGYLPLQDSSGMWHQVLTHPDSYPETSCTAMFTYAFSRGIQLGLYDDPKPYSDAAFKAWKGLCATSVDRNGNVHGVCRGSEFSFSPEYYKNDLLWRLNDTHGIGIVLLAASELIHLSDFMSTDQK